MLRHVFTLPCRLCLKLPSPVSSTAPLLSRVSDGIHSATGVWADVLCSPTPSFIGFHHQQGGNLWLEDLAQANGDSASCASTVQYPLHGAWRAITTPLCTIPCHSSCARSSIIILFYPKVHVASLESTYWCSDCWCRGAHVCELQV